MNRTQTTEQILFTFAPGHTPFPCYTRGHTGQGIFSSVLLFERNIFGDLRFTTFFIQVRLGTPLCFRATLLPGRLHGSLPFAFLRVCATTPPPFFSSGFWTSSHGLGIRLSGALLFFRVRTTAGLPPWIIFVAPLFSCPPLGRIHIGLARCRHSYRRRGPWRRHPSQRGCRHAAVHTRGLNLHGRQSFCGRPVSPHTSGGITRTPR